LSKIKKVQKATFKKLKDEALKKMKAVFIKRMKNTIDRRLFKNNAILELESILFWTGSMGFSNHHSQIFQFTMSHVELDGISSYFNNYIDQGFKDHFQFIASPQSLNLTNTSSFALHAVTLSEMMNWMIENGYQNFEEIVKLESRKSFQIAIGFARGEIQKQIKENGLTARECAKELNAEGFAPYISDTFNNNVRINSKNIYQNLRLMRQVIDYCKFYEISIQKDFELRYNTILRKNV
jgi:hypothetical protein